MANIKDIAKLAGVSVATVSRALKKPDMVKKATRDVVSAAIAELSYKPNALASGLRRQKSDSIVVIVPFIQNPFYSGIVQGIENIAHAHGYKVLLGESQNNQKRLDSYAEMVMTKQADGLILLGAMLPTYMKNDLEENQTPSIPVVMACEYFDGFDIPNVRIDNVEAATAATNHLIALGHRRIAKITGPVSNPLSKDRLKGYKAALKKAKIKLDSSLIATGEFSVHSGYKAMTTLLNEAPDMTAVFCSNDEMALGAMKAIKERRLRVAKDISVIGFDNVWFAEYTDPPLTTICQPHVEIGETTMKLMLDISNNGPKLPQKIILPHQLIRRSSTASVT